MSWARATARGDGRATTTSAARQVRAASAVAPNSLARRPRIGTCRRSTPADSASPAASNRNVTRSLTSASDSCSASAPVASAPSPATSTTTARVARPKRWASAARASCPASANARSPMAPTTSRRSPSTPASPSATAA